MTQYRVTAPVVVVKTMTEQGVAWKHLQQGALVPGDAEAEWIGYHLRDQMITPLPEAKAAPAPEPAAADPAAPKARGVTPGLKAGGG